MIKFDWQNRDLPLGAWYAAVALTVMLLAQFRGADWMVAGLSALLAWLPLLLTEQRHFRSGLLALVIYLFAGCALSVLGHWALASEIGRIAAVGGVALLAALMLLFGAFWYLVGYVLLFWYILSPLFSFSLGLEETLIGHVVGVLGILIFWVTRRILVDGWTWRHAWPEMQPMPPRIVLGYAGVLLATMMIGIGVGGRILTADPTLMAQASLNIIAPSFKQTWQSGATRMIFGFGGLLIGFYLGFYLSSMLLYQVVIAVCSFVALAFFRVHMAFLTGAFALMFAYPIGERGGEIAHAIGNERLLAELLGIVLACVAIAALSWIQRDKNA